MDSLVEAIEIMSENVFNKKISCKLILLITFQGA